MILGVGPASAHDELDQHVRRELATVDGAPAGPADPDLLTLFDAMAGSRLLDIHARRQREVGRGFYTIGSSGHESNAYVAEALRPTDPALLHYRSGGFFLRRALQAGRSLDDRPARGAAEHAGQRRRPGLGRAAQGVGRRCPGRDPADLDHRLAPAAGPRRRDVGEPRAAAAGRGALATRRGDGVQLRRRQHQPLDRRRRAQRRRLHRGPGPAAAAAVRVRGQRDRHLRPHPSGLGRLSRAASRHRVRRRRR